MIFGPIASKAMFCHEELTMSIGKIAAIIVAAGKGTRAGSALPKQYRLIGGKPVLAHTLEAFLQHDAVEYVLPVISENDEYYEKTAAPVASDKLLQPVIGGATRQKSVRNGLEALSKLDVTHVLIHDAARPFVSEGIITDIVAGLQDNQAVIPAVAIKDTLKRVSSDMTIEQSVDREGLWGAQTPQGFDYQLITKLHTEHHDKQVTDDASLCELAGQPVAIIEGDAANFKITTPEDFLLAEKHLQTQHEFRTGSGFDVHAFETGDAVTLCGVSIPHTHKLKGHSDADVAMHTLTDAIYGAIAAGDIGQHFPPSEEKWRGASSDIFLKHACEMVRERGGELTSVDVTIICEAPKVGPHHEAMQQRLADIIGISPSRISVKATTTEKLGFTGRGEGIAASAIATVRMPMEA
jgi:2-C-methyl-D-erythritol 4-phosphate cytidylyltransferase/2-C-methyl-D-erythritol 2,4-cyclodiphosphate synthase